MGNGKAVIVSPGAGVGTDLRRVGMGRLGGLAGILSCGGAATTYTGFSVKPRALDSAITRSSWAWFGTSKILSTTTNVNTSAIRRRNRMFSGLLRVPHETKANRRKLVVFVSVPGAVSCIVKISLDWLSE